MRKTVSTSRSARVVPILAIPVLSVALLGMSGGMGGRGFAQSAPPTEHKGLSVESLGFVPAESMSAQVGLGGHILLLRKIIIQPGGQIAKHSAEFDSGGGLHGQRHLDRRPNQR